MSSASYTLPDFLQHFMQMSSPQKVFLAVIGFLAIVFLESMDRMLMIFGISGFLLYESFQRSKSVRLKKGKSNKITTAVNGLAVTHEKPAKKLVGGNVRKKAARVPTDQRQFIFQPTVKKVEAPSFTSTGFENEVHELLGQLYTTTESDNVVRGIEDIVKQKILPMIPEAKITGYACVNVLAPQNCGVAIPELEIVLTADEAVILKRLEEGVGASRFDNVRRLFENTQGFSVKAMKASLRTCCEILTQKPTSNVKFRRSAFSGDEHKIILLIPEAAGLCKTSVPFNLSINCSTPDNGFMMLNELQQKEPRAHQLALLVRRWARDRSISHASKGSLSPYTWSVLSVKFILMCKSQGDVSTKTVTELFKEFVRFHLLYFDWSADIADPYDATKNLTNSLTEIGRSRIDEELGRAQDMCESDLSLPELLTPWAPADPTEANLENEQ